MYFHPLHTATSHQSTRAAAIALLCDWLHVLGGAAGFAVRFMALSLLACLFVSAPISTREVPYDNHRSSSRR